MSPGVFVGWIVVVGFAATLILTLLGLVKLVKMDPKYFSWLFRILIVEMIGAAFWLFELEFQQPMLSFDPAIPFEVYLFDGTGEPLGETRLVLGDETERTFNTTDVVFDIPRDFEIEDDQLLIMSRRANHQLGRISVEELSREASADLLSFQENLSLGIHYSECVDDTCQQRRDPNRAVIHLLAALTTDEDRENDHESAARQLFYLQNELQTCEAFGTLTSEIEMHIAVGTALTGGPPHRSQRALLTHWAPTSGHDAQSLFGVRVQNTNRWKPAVGQTVHALPGHPVSLAPLP